MLSRKLDRTIKKSAHHPDGLEGSHRSRGFYTKPSIRQFCRDGAMVDSARSAPRAAGTGSIFPCCYQRGTLKISLTLRSAARPHPPAAERRQEAESPLLLGEDLPLSAPPAR